MPACDNCCTFPVLLHRGNSGYAPAYESVTQKILLDRVEGEIGEVAGLDPSVSLRSVDEAAIAEAAAVFYLTGTGQATRTELIRMLGWRGDDVRVRLLLDRLERFFLNGVAS